MYTSWGKSAGSAVHSFRHCRLSRGTWKAVWRTVADWTARRKSLEYTAVGFANGHSVARRLIWRHPSDDSGARSKFDVFAGRTIAPWRTRTRRDSRSTGMAFTRPRRPRSRGPSRRLA